MHVDLRGGATTSNGVEEDDDDEEEDEEDEEPRKQETDSPSGDEGTGGEASTASNWKDSESNKKLNEDDNDSGGHPMSTVMPMQPVTVSVNTRVGESTLDRMASVEVMVHRSRDVKSLKQTLRRQLHGRPPVDTIRLLQGGIELRDDLLVNELIEDDEEDSDDDDNEDEDPEDRDDDGSGRKGRKNRLALQLDMVPPIDPRFVGQLQAQMDDMTVSELLDAYAANEAAAYVNARLLEEDAADLSRDDDEEDEDGEGVRQARRQRTTASRRSVIAQIKEVTARIRKDLDATVLQSEAAQKLVRDSVAPSLTHSPNLQERQVRGQRIRQAAQGGVRTTLRRKVQRNLNVNWPDTIRHFCLFLFFGYFGGRTPFSRAVLLLGAPSVFLLQARAVKMWIRQALYAVADHPPPILLSLLPAPQQSILSLDVREAMETIYGDYAVELHRATAKESMGNTEDEDLDEDDEEGDDENESVDETDGSDEE